MRRLLPLELTDRGGNYITGARVFLFAGATGTTVPSGSDIAGSVYTVSSGGSPLSVVGGDTGQLTDANGELNLWLDTPQLVDVVFTDNANTATYSSHPHGTTDFANILQPYDLNTAFYGAASVIDAGAGQFNVLDYGAVGDGSTDDSAAIASAVAAAVATAKPAIVYFPPPANFYRVNASASDKAISIAASNIWLQGPGVRVASGNDTPQGGIQVTGTYGAYAKPYITFSGNNSGIVGLSVDAGNVYQDVVLTSGSGCRLDRAFITHGYRYTWDSGAGQSDDIATDTAFIQSKTGTPGSGNVLLQGSDNRIFNCDIRRGGWDATKGILNSSGANNQVHGTHIIGNSAIRSGTATFTNGSANFTLGTLSLQTSDFTNAVGVRIIGAGSPDILTTLDVTGTTGSPKLSAVFTGPTNTYTVAVAETQRILFVSAGSDCLFANNYYDTCAAGPMIQVSAGKQWIRGGTCWQGPVFTPVPGDGVWPVISVDAGVNHVEFAPDAIIMDNASAHDRRATYAISLPGGGGSNSNVTLGPISYIEGCLALWDTRPAFATVPAFGVSGGTGVAFGSSALVAGTKTVTHGLPGGTSSTPKFVTVANTTNPPSGPLSVVNIGVTTFDVKGTGTDTFTWKAEL